MIIHSQCQVTYMYRDEEWVKPKPELKLRKFAQPKLRALFYNCVPQHLLCYIMCGTSSSLSKSTKVVSKLS
jgi:hypothetical protein